MKQRSGAASSSTLGKLLVLTLDHDPTQQEIYNFLFPNLSKFQFRQLLTLQQLIGLDGYESLSLPDEQKAVLKTLIKNFEAVTFVCLTDPATIAAIGLMVQYQLLTQEEGARILAGQLPPQ